MDKTVPKWAKSLTGHQIDGFIIDEFVGAGKIGHVFRAHRAVLPDHPVALKLTFNLPDGWENELNKVAALAGVSNVVQFQHLGSSLIPFEGGTKPAQYTVWQFIQPGRNLSTYLEELSSVPVSFYISMIQTVLRVLHYCSARGVPRHGDLHAGNILIGDADESALTPDDRDVEEIYVSDFGFGTTGGAKQPKDDYLGLAQIANQIAKKIDWDSTSGIDRYVFTEAKTLISKCLGERSTPERLSPDQLFYKINEIRDMAKNPNLGASGGADGSGAFGEFRVGNYPNGEMFGDVWPRWQALFVSAAPARSRIFEPGLTSVITGPRGCGKTLLFRRLSKRLMIECGPIDDGDDPEFIGFYVNANTIADAFPNFPDDPTEIQRRQLITFSHLALLTDFLDVLSAYRAHGGDISDALVPKIRQYLEPGGVERANVAGEDHLENLQAHLESVKKTFLTAIPKSEGLAESAIGHQAWLEGFFKDVARPHCDWINHNQIFLLIDDYTTPRISRPMQIVLNRIFFRRSDQYVTKIATEAPTTYIPQDASGKSFQINDDYRLVDMATESLAMGVEERTEYLEQVFSKRLSRDERIPKNAHTLDGLLGTLGMSKNEFARRLWARGKDPKYAGRETFVALWSGDTRTMLQLVTDLVDAGYNRSTRTFHCPTPGEQNEVLVRKGSVWMDELLHYLPSNPRIEKNINGDERFHGLTNGHYGRHLRAIVEAFINKARKQLFQRPYTQDGAKIVRSAFRIEIQDDLRLDGAASDLFDDLIRYGILLRDARGKSIRGAMVPRLFLRRLVLPFAKLGLSTKDSVRMDCNEFQLMLLDPDGHKKKVGEPRRPKSGHEQSPSNQGRLDGV